MEQQQALALAVIVVGVFLFASPVYLFPHAGQEEYIHFVEEKQEDEIPSDETVIEYGSLSPEAKTAFDKARTNEESVTFIYGKKQKPPESTHTSMRFSTTILRKVADSTNYRL